MHRRVTIPLVLAAIVAALAAGSLAKAKGPATAKARPSAPKAKAGATTGVHCESGGIVADPDPNGLNVRDAPHGKVVGRLPKDTEVGFAESRGHWIRIMSAWHADDPEGKKRPLGWVWAPLLTTDLKTPAEYGPHFQPMLADAPKHAAKTRPIPVRPVPRITIESCRGWFLQVRLTWPHRKPMTGWLEAKYHCPSTVTTCP